MYSVYVLVTIVHDTVIYYHVYCTVCPPVRCTAVYYTAMETDHRRVVQEHHIIQSLMSGSLIKVCPTQYIHTCTLYMYRCILLAGNLERKLQAIILDAPYKDYGLSEIMFHLKFPASTIQL